MLRHGAVRVSKDQVESGESGSKIFLSISSELIKQIVCLFTPPRLDNGNTFKDLN